MKRLREFAAAFRQGWDEAPTFRDVWRVMAVWWTEHFL